MIRKEITTYNGLAQTIFYEYDSENRITTIKQSDNNAAPTIAVTITYNGNEATLASSPKYDPYYNISKEVHLIVDNQGRLVKKTGYSLMVPPTDPTSKRFKYDTLQCVYDAAGFLANTSRHFYDSSWVAPGYTSADRATFSDTFTTTSNNLTTQKSVVRYIRRTVNSNGINLSGGEVTYTHNFTYTQSFPNKADFTNQAILNETQDFYGFQDYYHSMDYLEPFLVQYQYMPDRTDHQSMEKDLSGNITATYTSGFQVNRTYQPNGLLSTVEILGTGSAFKMIKYFYSN